MPTSEVALTPPVLPDSAPIKPAPPKALPRQRQASAHRAHSIEFDPLVVAKGAAGWESSLKAVVEAWVEAAAAEVTGGTAAPSLAASSVAPSEAQPTPDVAAAALPEPTPEVTSTPLPEEPEATPETETQDSEAADATTETAEAEPENAVEHSLQ